MAKRCSHCGTHDNPPEYEFCRFDGYELIEEDATSTLPPVPPPISPVNTGKANVTGLPATPVGQPVPASSGKAKLVVLSSGQPVHEFVISGSQSVIGRWDAEVSAFPDIDLSDYDPGCYISRHHARLFVTNGKYFIEDLGSSNKTIINKANKLNPHAAAQLQNGDEIIIGKTFLKFVLEY